MTSASAGWNGDSLGAPTPTRSASQGAPKELPSRATRDKSGTIANLTSLHTPFRAPTFETWRPTTDRTGESPGAAAGLRKRKGWQAGVLESTAIGSEDGEMALWAPRKAPFSVIFPEFFDDFLRVFPSARL
jgi:hypothetical protein